MFVFVHELPILKMKKWGGFWAQLTSRTLADTGEVAFVAVILAITGSMASGTDCDDCKMVGQH